MLQVFMRGCNWSTWDCYWWKYQKNTQQQLQDNFLKGEEVVYEVEINIANNQTSTILSLRPTR
jgi:hypothetical protein